MEYEKFLEEIKKHGFSEEDTKQGGLSFVGSLRDLKAGVQFVEDNENPIAILGGEFFFTGISAGGRINNAVLILTDQRIIKADKKIKNTDATFFYVDDIKSSMAKTSFLSSSLQISTTSGKISLNKVKKDTAIRFNKKLNEQIRAHKDALKNPKVVNASSGMEEIKKAKELFDSGIISEEEFQKVKDKHI